MTYSCWLKAVQAREEATVRQKGAGKTAGAITPCGDKAFAIPPALQTWNLSQVSDQAVFNNNANWNDTSAW